VVKNFQCNTLFTNVMAIIFLSHHDIHNVNGKHCKMKLALYFLRVHNSFNATKTKERK
jgi:hypothetical protein